MVRAKWLPHRNRKRQKGKFSRKQEQDLETEGIQMSNQAGVP